MKKPDEQPRKRSENEEPILIEETFMPQTYHDYLWEHGVHQLRTAYQERTGRKYPAYDFSSGENIEKYVETLEAEFAGENLRAVIEQDTDPRTIDELLEEPQRTRATDEQSE